MEKISRKVFGKEKIEDLSLSVGDWVKIKSQQDIVF